MMHLDDTDRKIVELLQGNARMSVAEIARNIGLSRVAAHERFNRLVDAGVIEDFVAIVNSAALGYTVSAFLEIEIAPNRLVPICEALASIPEVTIVYQMTGPTSLHVHAYARDSDDLSNFLRDSVYPIEGVIKVTTSLLLKRFKSFLALR
jgi:DNA-binding Lrp family transcriptional regulator